MKKKLLVLAIAACMAIPFAGCTRQETEETTSNQTTQEETEQTQEETTDTTEGQTEETQPTEEETTSDKTITAADGTVFNQDYLSGNNYAIYYYYIEQCADENVMNTINEKIRSDVEKVREIYMLDDGSESDTLKLRSQMYYTDSTKIFSIKYEGYYETEDSGEVALLFTENFSLEDGSRIRLGEKYAVRHLAYILETAVADHEKESVANEQTAYLKENIDAVEEMLYDSDLSDDFETLPAICSIMGENAEEIKIFIPVPHDMGDFAQFTVLTSEAKTQS